MVFNCQIFILFPKRLLSIWMDKFLLSYLIYGQFLAKYYYGWFPLHQLHHKIEQENQCWLVLTVLWESPILILREAFKNWPNFWKKKEEGFSVVILALVFRLLKVKDPLFLKEPILIINKNCSTLEKKHCMVGLVCTMICIIILELTSIVHTP